MVQDKAAKTMSSVGGAQAAKKGGVVSFVTETWAEFKKVVWPTRRELIRLTLIVIVITSGLGLILGGIDYGFSRLITILGGTG
jgi:preprotein translocase subunit SecE